MKIRERKFIEFSEIRQLIARDKLIESLEKLQSILSNSKDANFVFEQKARLAASTKQADLNLISLSDLNIEKSKIRLAILGKLNDLEIETDKQPKTVSLISLKLVLGFVVLMVLLLSFYYLIGFRDSAELRNDTIKNSPDAEFNFTQQETEVATISGNDQTYSENRSKIEPVSPMVSSDLERQLEEEPLITTTIKLESDLMSDLHGFVIYFEDASLRDNKDTTNVQGKATYSFPASHKFIKSRIIVEYEGKIVVETPNHSVAEGLIPVKID